MQLAWIAVILGLVVAADSDPRPRPIDPALQPELQSLATKACQCERDVSTVVAKAECWDAYNRLGRAAIHGGWSTACAPISAGGHSYNSETPKEFSIYTGSYSQIGTLCTPDEVTAVETAWQRAYDAGVSGETMDAEMRKALKDFQDGRQVAMTGGGCGRPSRARPPPVSAG